MLFRTHQRSEQEEWEVKVEMTLVIILTRFCPVVRLRMNELYFLF